MRFRCAFSVFLSLIAVSCSYEEMITPEESIDNSAVEFYATIDEQPYADTKVYADDKLRVLWNADDRITIFNKNTYNQQYRFTGEDGDNAGGFKPVQGDDYVTGNDLPLAYAVYPYNESTKISNDGIITTSIPSEQIYKEGSFGVGANTMVSMSASKMLKFKNIGGYLSLKFYGDDVSVSSIIIHGNNSESISGQCSIDMSSGIPVSSMDENFAVNQIMLKCENSVKIGGTSGEASEFLFVVSPVILSKGFTVTVFSSDGRVFKKTSTKPLEIKRSSMTRMSALEVKLEDVQPNNVVYYTSTDGKLIDFHPSSFMSANVLSNKYENGQGVLTFDVDVTDIDLGYLSHFKRDDTWVSHYDGDNRLSSISIPGSVLRFYNHITGVPLASIKVDPSNLVYDSREDCNAIIKTETNTLILGCCNTVIPKSVTCIYTEAFTNCRGLTSITIPNSVLEIGDRAFMSCSGLISITISDSVLRIGESAFYGCRSLTSITIPNSVIKVGNQAFKDCPSLTSIVIPSSVVEIGESAFSGCDDLSTIVVNSDNPVYDSRENSNAIIETVSNKLIVGCSNSTIPNSVQSIGAFAFADCKGLTSISIPESISSIEESAFYGCTNLTSIVLPESVTEIESGFLCSCTNLASINGARELIMNGKLIAVAPAGLTSYAIPDGVTAIGREVFYSCPFTSITIPESVRTIEDNSFAFTRLSSITIPDSVSEIGAGAFKFCPGLSSITIPSSVSSIGNACFLMCTGLTSITVEAINPPLCSPTAMLASNDCPIYVPAESVEAYKSADGWKTYADRIKPIENDY